MWRKVNLVQFYFKESNQTLVRLGILIFSRDNLPGDLKIIRSKDGKVLLPTNQWYISAHLGEYEFTLEVAYSIGNG